MLETARSPRAVLVATLTTCLLAVQYAVSDALAWQIQEHDIGNDGFLSVVVLHAVEPFYGGLFRPEVNADIVVPWAAGLLVAVGVAWLVIVIASRKGSLAAFVGGWIAVILASWAGGLVAAFLWIQMSEIPDTDTVRTQVLAFAFDRGLHYGFLFGWFPALVAALLAGVLRKREVTQEESAEPEPRMM